MIFNNFSNFNTITLAGIGGLFSFFLASLGAFSVFLFSKNIKEHTLTAMYGFASGIMVSVTIWSLLIPSVDALDSGSIYKWLIPSLGIIAGAFLISLIDVILPHIHSEDNEREGIKTNWSKGILLTLAITIHNIPEGLAIGVAFGSIGSGIEGASIYGAFALALGIGLQNIPESMAISIPLHMSGMSKIKSFLIGAVSSVVEPVFAILGAILVKKVSSILPFILSFTAGAMIYVVVEELIPAATSSTENRHFGVWGFIFGFIIMMILELGLSF